MPGTNTVSKKVESAAVKAADLVVEINKEIETVKMKREAVRNIIRTVPNARYRFILELRYINGLKPEEIAVKNGKSDKWIREILRNAINSVK